MEDYVKLLKTIFDFGALRCGSGGGDGSETERNGGRARGDGDRPCPPAPQPHAALRSHARDPSAHLFVSRLLARPDFSFVFDGMAGVAGPYARALFVGELGAPAASLLRCEPMEDFGGGHPGGSRVGGVGWVGGAQS